MKHILTYKQTLLANSFLKENSKLLEQTLLDNDMQTLKLKVRNLIKSYLKGKGYDPASKTYANDLTLLTYTILNTLNQYR